MPPQSFPPTPGSSTILNASPGVKTDSFPGLVSFAKPTTFHRPRSLQETFRATLGNLRKNLQASKHLSDPLPIGQASPQAIFHYEDPEVADANCNITQLIREAMTCSIHKDIVLSLRDEAAADTLQVMQRIMDDPASYRMDIHRHKLHRFLIKLSRDTRILPASFFLSGVYCENREPLSGGSFADIFYATVSEKPVALKRLRIFQFSSDQERKDNISALFREAIVWRQLHHPNILPFWGVDRETFQPWLCMVSPFMCNGNILQCMEHFQELNADIPRESWILEIAKGLEYLHHEQVVHGDLRGANILIDDDHHVRLADFGLAMLADAGSGSMSGNSGGATRYSAPELLQGSQSCPKSDIYAFACTCIEIYTKLPPFSNLSDALVRRYVPKGIRPLRPGDNARMQDYVWDVVTRCWRQHASSRPDASYIVQSLSSYGERETAPSGSTPTPSASPSRKSTARASSRSSGDHQKADINPVRLELVDISNTHPSNDSPSATPLSSPFVMLSPIHSSSSFSSSFDASHSSPSILCPSPRSKLSDSPSAIGFGSLRFDVSGPGSSDTHSEAYASSIELV